MDIIYPIGSIYLSTSPNNPSLKLGGTWVAWGSSRVPVGVNSGDANFNAVEKVGGSSTVALSIANMPRHAHTGSTTTAGNHTHNTGSNHKFTTNYTFAHNNISRNRVKVDTSSKWFAVVTSTQSLIDEITNVGYSGNHNHAVSIASAGSGAAHSNLQPYITCYMWKRTG